MPESLVVFHRFAASEYRSSRDWYSSRSPAVAVRFRLAVDRAVDRIAADADSLARLVGEYRYVRVSQFPYILIFRRLNTTAVMVVAVAHTSRRPGYWRCRR
jgi:toxin ParE1/3/4